MLVVTPSQRLFFYMHTIAVSLFYQTVLLMPQIIDCGLLRSATELDSTSMNEFVWKHLC